MVRKDTFFFFLIKVLVGGQTQAGCGKEAGRQDRGPGLELALAD